MYASLLYVNEVPRARKRDAPYHRVGSLEAQLTTRRAPPTTPFIYMIHLHLVEN